MSSSQSIPVPQPQSQPADSDSVMVEAPDSPPTTTTNNNTMFALPLPSFSGAQNAPQTQANSGAQRTSLNGGESSSASASSVGGGKHNFGLPGSSYQNKKFHEDFVRASENLTDKEWDATQYGDPLMVHNGFVVPK
ncbi:hypothetical protein HYFRA_00012411 [Hymenoscyphus fraxineus]|uniref:Uncharacterized protein n=1 Tax=Hymenoscyphus fraxineus TaxID=746836 RepID=A0A9N9Q028_9HELO|nr:hypothetical protein HYFRA_00012411 [Hymenoscyphus fraxineus]